MRIAHDVLRRFLPALPTDPRAVRDLLDDLGLEVKRTEEDGVTTVFTLELLANRGDHHCYEGVARELAARLDAELVLPAVAEIETGGDPWPVRVETPLCLQYGATLLEKVGDGIFDASALRVLEAAGIHSLGPAIDATNLSNLELGQPTHAFDADKIEGAVVIRTSRPGERAWPLFRDEPVVLPEDTLVIADEAKVLAVAGVIGCEESKTTDQTRRVLLESATFDPVSVRKASRALGIHTDSSARFERGADPERVLLGTGRVVHLLEGAGWQRVGATTVQGDWTDPKRVIPLDVDAANAFLGTSLTADDARGILDRLGFSVEENDRGLQVRVPPRRLWDVEHVQDLYEELAKIVGYNDTPIGLPAVDQGALPSPAEVRRRTVDEVLLGAGFYEVVTDGFYGRDVLDLLGLTEAHPLWRHVETQNALDRAYSLLKNNALAQAVQAVGVNLNRRNPDVKAFEWTRTFHPIPAVIASRTQPPCTERPLVWAIASGTAYDRGWAGDDQPADVWFLAGLVREIGVALRLELTLSTEGVEEHPLATCLHPGRRARIVRGDGQTVGILGEVHPAVLKRARIKAARPCYFELEADALVEGPRPPYEEPPAVHPIVRSLAFTLPDRFEAGRVQACLRASGPTWLEGVDITDLFAHERDGQPVRTVTYALRFANPEANRTADEVNAAVEQLVQAVETQFADQDVRLRR